MKKLKTAIHIEGQEEWTKKTAFVSGHIQITEEEFATHYIPLLDKAIENKQSFVIGDADGVDAMAQKYLEQKGVTDITVYHMFISPRNTVSCAKLMGGFKTDDSRDAAMTNASSYDIAWVRRGKEKSGTQKNLDRRLQTKVRVNRLLEKWARVLDYNPNDPEKLASTMLIESQEHWIEKPSEEDKRWPRIGDKVKFLTAEGRFFPHYTNIIANAKDKLRMGGIYTVSRREVHSSWCAVWLEGFGDDEFFHLSMFEFPIED